jgi:excisionase family DNA binding protein
MTYDGLMTVKEAAGYLRLNYMTVYKLAQQRRLPVSKVGGNWRFSKELLDRWMAQQASITSNSILIVDDSPVIREILRDIVVKEGHTAVTVDSGELALEEVQKKHFDLIFLDLKLGGISGIEVLEQIKDQDKEAAVVVVTGFAEDPIALKAMSLGPLLLIRKPFREKDILEVLNMLVRKRLA